MNKNGIINLRYYRTLQHLSIDIVAGAIVLLHFFSRPFQVAIEWPVYVLLGSSVWIIYTIDHLRDAAKAQDSIRARYVFHRKNSAVLKRIVIAVMALSGICLFLIPFQLLIAGVIIAGFSGIYLLLQHQLANQGLKEVYVAVTYSAGILAAPVSLSGTFDLYLFLMLFIVTFLNLALFSWFETTADATDGFRSITTQWGKTNVEKLLLLVVAAGISLTINLLIWSLPYAVYFGTVLVIYAVLILRPGWSEKNERYRTIGDGAFLLPLLFEWM